MISLLQENGLKLLATLIDDISQAWDANYIQRLLVNYFTSDESATEKNEALKLLLGICPKKIVSSKQLKSWTNDLTGYPSWLIERSEKEAGSFLKTLALLLNSTKSQSSDLPLSHWLFSISEVSQSEQKILKFVKKDLAALDTSELLILLKLMTGTFKSPTTTKEIIQSLSRVWSIDPHILSYRMYHRRLSELNLFPGMLEPMDEEKMVIPLPFPTIEIFNSPPEHLGDFADWEAFGHQQGLEAQLIKYGKIIHLWNSDGIIITDKFPEFINSCKVIPSDFVIYGVLLPKSKTSSFELIKSRLQKKVIGKKDFQATEPLFAACEILRYSSYSKAFTKIDFINSFQDHLNIQFIENLHFTSWTALEDLHKKCREFNFSGIYLKKKKIPGHYLFWKATSYTIKAVLIYVELDPGERSGIKSMTFGLRKEEKIVPVAKVSKVDKSIDLDEILSFAKANTLERFGPIRTIKPSLVYELHFDTITPAPRRKSGLMLSNVLINKKIDINSLLVDDLKTLKKMS